MHYCQFFFTFRFCALLDFQIVFTQVLHLIRERPNICSSLHIPAQSGNSEVLERMRRGYSRESYLELISHIQSILPNVALSSDFIAGFCGETEEQFADTISLIDQVPYSTAYLFAYSMRQVSVMVMILTPFICTIYLDYVAQKITDYFVENNST